MLTVLLIVIAILLLAGGGRGYRRLGRRGAWSRERPGSPDNRRRARKPSGGQ
jgi:hypothetical protein